MATGPKANNVIPAIGARSWEDEFAIDADDLTSATRANFLVSQFVNPNGGRNIAHALYTGTGALVTSEFNNFPAGSFIEAIAITTPVKLWKQDATTWLTQPISA